LHTQWEKGAVVTEELTLGIDGMDMIHAQFITLFERVKQSSGTDFIAAFEALIEHTDEHFSQEEAIMRACDYYGTEEHMNEHRVLLDEMRYFFAKAKKLPPFGRSYIDDYAMEKFRRHVVNIDSQLAMFLKSEAASTETAPV
jgi:hemerythrin-like metal-binding protein